MTEQDFQASPESMRIAINDAMRCARQNQIVVASLPQRFQFQAYLALLVTASILPSTPLWAFWSDVVNYLE